MASSSLEPWQNLEGKVVMVTGASSGIGYELCINLAQAGCKVLAAARRIDRLKALCDEINGSSSEPRAVPLALDVSADGPAVEAAVKKAWDAFGRIDGLINNAGARGNVSHSLDLTEEEFDSVIKTNFKGAWLVSKYVCIHMRDAKCKGSIINISSAAGLNRGELPGGVVYAASKAAMNAMTKMMALELGENNIRVNSIAPGLFMSEITKGVMTKKWFNNIALRAVPLRTFGTTDPAMTSVVRYLIHDSSEYVSGNIFIVDSGLTLPGAPIFSSL